MKSKYWKYGIMFGFFFLAMVAATGGVIMLLWNNLMPELFNVQQITFVQAFGLLILVRLLTGGGMGGWKRCGGGWNRGWGNGWNHGWKQKWSNMSPEDREKMKEKFMNHCGRAPKPSQEEEVFGKD
jgi:hypothetical protein